METRQLIKMLGGAIAIIALVIIIAALVPTKARAEMDSDQRNPGNDKEEATVTTVIDLKIAEVGTAMKGWAFAFGSGVEKNWLETQKVFLNDIEKIKQSSIVQETVQFQKTNWQQGKEDLAKTRETLVQKGEEITRSAGTIIDGIAGLAKAMLYVRTAEYDGKTEK